MSKTVRGRVCCVLAALSLCCGLVVIAAAGPSAAACWKCAPGARSAGYAWNQLNGVAAVSGSDAWAVGYFSNGSADTALVVHWNGRGWRIRASPNPGYTGSALYGVAAVSGTSAWAVGTVTERVGAHTLIEHWDGRRWSVQPSPNPLPGPDQLTAVAALSNSNAWAVGAYGLGRTLVEHWNGSTWQVQASPSPGSLGSGLTSVAAISPSNVWAVGSTLDDLGDIVVSRTLIEHWNGSRWAVYPSPDPSTQANVLNGVSAAGPTNIWAVGTYDDASSIQRALIARWTGKGWATQASPTSAFGIALQSVAILSDTVAWAAGYTGSRTLAEHWNGRAWQIQTTPDPIFSADPHLALTGVAAVSGSDAWVVGYNGEEYNPDARTLIEHWDGRSWQTQPSPSLP